MAKKKTKYVCQECGMANFSESSTTMKIADDLEKYLRSCGLKNIRELVGKIKT